MKAENSDNRVLSHQDVEARLKTDLSKWQFRDGFLRRKYRTGGWKGTLMAINAIGHLAEAAWHHPDIHASYASVEISLQTHDAGGITEKDFELAKKIEEVVMWQPGKAGGILSGPPDDPRHAYIKYD